MTGEPDNVDWSDTEKLKADLYAVLCERNEMATEITDMRAKIGQLKAERTYIAETLYGELRAENARLLAALQRIADDGKNCTDYCRRQARAALEPKP
jgi:uncharacterized coiled-coil DUF342 family protein